jgi:hypothetical protein
MFPQPGAAPSLTQSCCAGESAAPGVAHRAALGPYQFRDLDRRDLNTCFWITVTVATLIYAVLALSASVIASWPSRFQPIPA